MSKGKVISFISGKGGVGKTTIASSLGYLLNEVGFRVLLIDADLFSHGLTFLLSPKLESIKKKKGIIESIDDVSNITVIKSEYGIDYIASSTDPREITSDIVSNVSNFSDTVFKIIINKTENTYDYILIDTQPGPVKTTKSVVSFSDIVVIISETDALSQFTNLNLLGELHNVLPLNRVRNVKNKLFYNQLEKKKTVDEILGQLNYLPSIPFDRKVIDYLMINQIPVNFSDPSPFLFGLIRFSKSLLPEIINQLDPFLKKTQKTLLRPYEEKILNIEIKINDLEENKMKVKNELIDIEKGTYQLNIIKEMLPLSIMFIYVVTGLLRPYISLEIAYGYIGVGFIVFTILYVYTKFREDRLKNKLMSEKMMKNHQLDKVTKEISNLYDDLRYYKTLLNEKQLEYG
jgi:cellulose biosynthesis protein BcsQ